MVLTFSSQVLLAETGAINAGEAPVGGGKPNLSGSGAAQHPALGNSGPDIKINPFVGEIVVGASLLVAYGPQIIAAAIAVATLAASISMLMNTGKQSASMVKSIGDKLKRMLTMLIGPLSVSSGLTKDGVDGVSAQLLKTAKFVTNSLNTPVSTVQKSLDESIEMSKNVENIAGRGKDLSESMVKSSSDTSKELKSIVAGGEVQLFRDGANNVSQRLSKQAQTVTGAFNQTITNSKMSTYALESVKGNIDKALTASGKSADQVTLQELGLSGAEISKRLIEARKYMVMSRNSLDIADKSTSGLHSDILGLLGSMKKELEDFAASQGVDKTKLARVSKEQTQSQGAASGVSLSILKNTPAAETPRLTEEITFMVDELNEMNRRTTESIRKLDKPVANQVSTAQMYVDEPVSASTQNLFNTKLAAYRKFISTMTRDPGNRRAIEATKADYELAEQAFQDSQK